MEQTELTGIFCARPQNFAWFLGAGASATAGLPTASDVIWDLKRRQYAKMEGQEITRQDIQVQAVRDRIQDYMDANGYPSQWSPGEYAAYFEKIFGADKERQRAYMSAILSEEKVTLSVGGRALAAMMASGLTRAVFTTNFDTVVEKAMAEVAGKSLAAFHLEGARSAVQALNNEEFPLYCKLHGDFRHDSLKNLPQDLALQNAELSDCLLRASGRFGFIVVGYSGRDESVMALFREALKSRGAFPHGLFWTGLRDAGPPPLVTSLIEEARSVGVKADFVPIETFDAFMLRLWRNIDGKNPEYDGKVRRTTVSRISIPLPPEGRIPPLVRLNALPILTLPTKCQALTFRRPKEWADLRSATYNTEGALIVAKAERILCWGSKELVASEFRDVVSNESFDLSEKLGRLEEHTIVKAFVAEGVARALARGKPLLVKTERSGTYLIADRHAEDHILLDPVRKVVGNPFGDLPGLFAPVTEDHPEPQRMAWAESVKVTIDVKNGKPWLLLAPNVWIWPRRARETADEFLDKRRGDRFNNKHNDLLDAWITVLLGTTDRSNPVTMRAFENGTDIENPRFEIGPRSAFARKAA